jgi:signal peptidase I
MPGEERIKENIISASDWFTAIKPLLEDGNLLRISPSGLSMYPFLVGGRDEVFLRSTAVKKPVKGDIALFRREDGMHVLHRIHHIRNNRYYMLGDAQTGIEGPIDGKNVIAVVEAVIWKNRKIDCDNVILKTLSRIWTIIRPFRPIILKLRGFSCKYLRFSILLLL